MTTPKPRGRHVKDVEIYQRRQFTVQARQWVRDPYGDPEVRARSVVSWLNSFADIKAEYRSSNGLDFHSRTNILIRSEPNPRWDVTTHGHWFVMYPDGTYRIMTPLEFEDKFVSAVDLREKT